MSERGVFAVDRGIWDHPSFAREPFTEREAWVWLVGAAAWKQSRVRAGRHPVTVERGQAAFSERFLAVKWRWSKSRVHRFLDRLKIEAMVTISADHETNRITICNYEKYAFDGTTRNAKSGPQTEPIADQPRTKEEELKEGKKEEKKDSRSDEFEEFWKACPKRMGSNPKALAEKKFRAVVKSGADPQAITLAARQWATSDRDKIGTPYIPQVSTWLGQQRFDDYRPPPSTAGPLQAPAGAPTDEELRRKYARQHHTVPPEAKAGCGGGPRTDHARELRRDGAEIRPILRAF